MVFAAIFTPGEIAAAGVVLPVVDSLLVALRLHIKRRRAEKLTLEDWFVIPALVLMIAMGVMTIVGVATHAEGYATPVSNPEQLEYEASMIQLIFWNTTWMQTLALGSLKLSFIFLYRRLFNVGGPRSTFNIASTASIAVIGVWTLTFFLGIMLFCPGHVSSFWSSIPEERAYCWDLTIFFYVLYWSDVATDLLVLLLPVPSIMKLRMDVRRKFAVACIFLLGFLTIAASVTRAILFTSLVATSGSVVALFPNKSNTNGLYLLLLETGLALIAINLPILYTTIKNEGMRSMFSRLRKISSGIYSSTTSSSKRKSEPPIVPEKEQDLEAGVEDLRIKIERSFQEAVELEPDGKNVTPSEEWSADVNNTLTSVSREHR